MPKIKQLSPHEAQKIAAGEVVERPANILKELIENAIDAESTHIKIFIKDGGKELIRVIDNGYGMDDEDARLCFNKHATSKIQSVEQLESIDTFGFRGEALASIAAVSRVTLITKQKNAAHGTKVHVEQNDIISQEIVSCPQGTDFSIADLFYTVPARKKFLKKKESEWRHIAQLFQAFCLDYSAIHFQLYSEDKNIYNCPPVTKLADRITQLWDHTTGSHAITAQHHNHKYDVTITGIITNHSYHRYDRNGIFFFVNNRWIKNFTLSTALLKGYLHVLPQGKYPLAALLITVPSEHVDINIHPRKEEVKFMHPRVVEQAIEQTAKEALEAHLSAQINIPVQFAPSIAPYQTNNYTPSSASFAYQQSPQAWPTSPVKPFFEKQREKEHSLNQTLFNDTQELLFSNILNEPAFKENQTVIHQSEKKHHIVGQLLKTYIIIEKPEGLFMIDQHAAHERILYESFKQRDNNQAPVNLLFPHLITLSAHDKKLLEPHLSLFIQNNIIIEPFGSNQLRITATPVHLKMMPLEDFIHQVIAWITEADDLENNESLSKIHDKMHMQMACKAAVKAGDILTIPEMQKLLTDLDATPSNFCCPHGRPTGWLLTVSEIEKKFRRDYKK